MDFVTSKESLLRELQAVQGIVEKKSTIPILSNILIDAKKEGLELLATDLEVGIRTTCEAKVAKPGSLTVSARRLFDIVRYLPDAEVRLRADEGHWITITCDKARFRIVGLSREDFPAMPEFDFSKAIPIERPLLLDLISKTIFAITTDETRYQINGTLLILNKKHLSLVATDGHRLAYASGRLEKGASETRIEVVVPRKAVQELLRLGEGEEEVSFGQKDNHVFFQVGRTILTSTVVPTKFPEYEKVIPEGNDKLVKVDCAAFGDVVRRVALLSSERSRAVKFSLGKGSLEITSSNPEVGEASESVDIDYDGPALEIGFNARYVTDFLQAVGQGQVILALKDESTQGVMRPVGQEGRDYRYVVMPMRI
ncbi:MAG TPA: DNA polymerase III subunit beta [Candidatus Polarisedimenticolia bacterium]|nr:DNA polymerase III subunit beta [Candidatus Polarisedimenticolia bacterium]